MVRAFVAGVVALFLAAPVVAKEKPELVRDIPTFLQKQAELRVSIEQSKKYSHVKPEAKQKIYAEQDKIATVLKGHKSVDELTTDEKVAVFNSQTEILAQLDNAEPDRVICANEAKTGTHLPTVTCTTQRERDLQREHVRDVMRFSQPGPGAPAGASGR